jgi:predicted ATP-dependent serine protease
MDQDATLIEPIKYVAPAKIEITKINERIEPNISRLSKRTLTFLLEGAELGTRHNELVKAAADAKEQGYSQDEFENMVAVMADKTGRFTWPDLGHSKAISDMFSKDSRYPPREGLEEPRTAFRFQTIDQLIEEKIELNWVVEDLLTEGGFSLIVGKAKTGKSTLVRQLVRCVCRGEPFLGRKTKQGRVLYLALEEQKAMLKTQFQAVGIAKKDPLLIHVGGVLSDSALYDLESALLETKPALLVVDTLFLLLNVQDGNSYGEMNRVLTTYRELARRTGTHIISIHHQNKNQFGGFDSIMGSSAIHGAADNVLLFTGDKTKRFITSSQRGGKAFKNQMLSFNEPIQTYSLSNNSVIPNSCLDDF